MKKGTKKREWMKRILVCVMCLAMIAPGLSDVSVYAADGNNEAVGENVVVESDTINENASTEFKLSEEESSEVTSTENTLTEGISAEETTTEETETEEVTTEETTTEETGTEEAAIEEMATEMLDGIEMLNEVMAEEVEDNELATNVKLTITESGKEVDGSMNFSTDYMVTYTFLPTFYISCEDDLSFAENGDYKYVKCGKTYDLPDMPKELALQFKDYMTRVSDTEYTWPAKATFNSGLEKEYGTIRAVVDSEGKTSLSITINTKEELGIDETDVIEISDAEAGMAVRLNKEIIQKEQNIEITFDDFGVVIEVEIDDNNKNKPSINKKAASADDFADTKQLVWTLQVQNDEYPEEYPEGITIKDVIPKDQKHVFVEGTFEKSTDGITWNKVDQSKVTISDDRKTLIYTDTEYDSTIPSQITCYRYRTEIVGELYLQDGKNETVKPTRKNGVSIYDASKSEDNLLAETDATWEGAEKKYEWIKKSFEEIQQKEDGAYVKWSIAINTYGYNAKNLVVYDAVSEEFKKDGKIEIIDATVKKAKDTDATSLGSSKIIIESGVSEPAGNRAYDLRFELGDYEDDDSPIILTYWMKFQNYDAFLHQNNDNPENTAWPEFDVYEYGYGLGGGDGSEGNRLHIVGPASTADTTKGLSSLMLIKEASGVDVAKRELTWTIKVNPNCVALTDIKLVDWIGLTKAQVNGEKEGTSNQEFVRFGSDTIDLRDKDGKIVDSIDLKKVVSYDEKGNPVINLGNSLYEKQITDLKIITRLKDSEAAIFASNKSNTYYNTAELIQNDRDKVQAQASQRYSNKVIGKSAPGGYHYDTHEIDWDITVNKDKTLLTEMVVTDTLHELLTLSKVSLKTEDGEFTELQQASSENGGTKPYYTVDGQKVTVYLPDVTEEEVGTAKATKIIRITTKVDPERFNYLEDNQTAEITNEATLETYANHTPVSSGKVKVSLTNDVLNKQGITNKEDNEITYQVKVNQAQQPLPANAVLTDTMSAGLQLQNDTVKLYEAVVASDGSMTAGREVDIKDSMSVTYAGGNTVLTVKLPENSSKAYLLIYKAYVVITKGELKNHIVLSGTNYKVSADTNYEARDFSYGSGNLMKRATIKKQDPEGNAIAGVTFAIEQQDSNNPEIFTPITTVTTNGKGCAYSPVLKLGIVYKAIEIYTPRGYVLDSTPQEFQLEEGKTVVLTFINQKQKGSVSFLKTGNRGELLAGATFGLYSVSENVETAMGITVTSDEYGNVTFSNLEPGTYHIKEETAPKGYQLSKDVYEVIVNNYGEVEKGPYLVGDNTQTTVKTVMNRRQPSTPSDDDDNDDGGNDDSGNGGSSGGTTTVTYNPNDTAVLGAIRPQGTVAIDDEETPLAAVLGADRLPKTGGFWGSGIIYIIGAFLILSGLGLFLFDEKKIHKR